MRVHGFTDVEDPHGRWWRNFRAYYWFTWPRLTLNIGGQWCHFHRTLRRLGLKVSTSGEETLDVWVGLGPLGQHWWKLDVSWRDRLRRLPGARLRVELGLTGAAWCLGSDDGSWHRDAPLRERLRRNSVTWWRVGWRRRSNEEVERVAAEVPLPEGPVPVDVALERSVWGVEVGPYRLSRRRRTPSLRFWLPGFRRINWTATVNADKSGGLKVPGKGENSWDCGQDAIYATSVSIGRPDAAEWVGQAIARATGAVYRTRSRYGAGIADTGA